MTRTIRSVRAHRILVGVSAVGAPLTIAVVLAAGGGSRFTGSSHKLLAPLGGRSVVDHAVDAAVASGIGPVLVISGAVELPATVAAMPGVEVRHHPGWAAGQATTLAVGLAEAERRGAVAVVVGLGDQPFITPAAWRAVARSTAPIAIATYEGLRRNPVRLHRSVWSLVPGEGDEGARSVARLRPDLVEEVPCPGSPADIDTVSDLQNAEVHRSWQNRSSTNSP